MGSRWYTGRLFPLLFTVALSCVLSIPPQAAKAQNAALDLHGKPADPLKRTPGKVVVLVFVRSDCPISNRYAPTLEKLGARYQDKAEFWLVYPSKAETSQSIEKHEREYGYKFPALRDPQHILVKESQAQITPEVAVFDRERHLVYHGRIDNLYVDAGRTRSAATTHELEDAILAATGGKALAVSAAQSVGCYIADLQ